MPVSAARLLVSIINILTARLSVVHVIEVMYCKTNVITTIKGTCVLNKVYYNIELVDTFKLVEMTGISLLLLALFQQKVKNETVSSYTVRC